MTVIGCDVSFYQDSPDTLRQIDFNQMKSAGAKFVIVRAGQNTWPDLDWAYNWQRSRDAGLPRGSYWFYDSRAEPRSQAELWVQLLGDDLGELPLFADFEETYGGIYSGWRNFKVFLERVRQLVVGHQIGIYTAYYYWRDTVRLPITEFEYFKQFPLWVANYGVNYPSVPLPWDSWLFWQYTDNGDGRQYGAESGNIDLDVFYGSQEMFDALYPPSNGHTMTDELIKTTPYFDGIVVKDYVAHLLRGGVQYHVAIVDVPKVDFFVSPRPLFRRYVPQFLEEFELSLASNGDGWTSDLINGIKMAGYAISSGEPYGTAGAEETVYINRQNQFATSRPTFDQFWMAISFPNKLIENGVLLPVDKDPMDIRARSAFGYTKDQQTAYFLWVDGGDYQELLGMNFPETAQRLLSLGCDYGVMLDGGGSTTAAVRENDMAKVINVPKGEDPVGNLMMRRVANILGVKTKAVITLPPNGDSMATVRGTVKTGLFANVKNSAGTIKAQMRWDSTLGKGDSVDGDWSSAHTDIVNFNKFTRADGSIFQLGEFCKVSVTNLITEDLTTPPPPPSDVTLVHTIRIYSDGSYQVDNGPITP